jgi:hypothetical protein
MNTLILEPNITEDDVRILLDRHGANYQVETIETPNPIGLDKTGFFTSYRTDTGKIFAQGLKKGWTPIQNAEAMRVLTELSKEVKVRLKHFFMFGGGAEICAQIDLGAKNLGNGDTVANYLSLINGHDGGHAMCVFDTPFRYWCKNQINGSINDARTRKSIVSIKHTASSAEKLEVLLTSIRLAQRDFSKSIEMYKQLMDTNVSDTFAHDIITGFFPIPEDLGPKGKTLRLNKIDDVLARYNSADQGRTPRETAWNLYNAVQGHIQHYGKPSESKQKSMLIGANSKKAAQAMAWILSITASQHLANALTIEEKEKISLI